MLTNTNVVSNLALSLFNLRQLHKFLN